MQEASLDAYEAMPVASFGEAMLRGMGWKEGMSVGRNTPKEVHPVICCQYSCIFCGRLRGSALNRHLPSDLNS